MKIKNLFVTFLGLVGIVTGVVQAGHLAVITVPISDLVGSPIGSRVYQTLPYAVGADNKLCVRTHQLLFNEQVEVIQEDGEEVRVKIPNMFYCTNNQPGDTFWMLRKNLITLKTLQDYHIDKKIFPTPINKKNYNSINPSPNIVNLLKPFTDQKSKRTFSAGTRFVALPATSINTSAYIPVYAFNPSTHTIDTLYLPRTICRTTYPTDQKNATHNFITLLKDWASLHKDYHIPYIWGGCSITTPLVATELNQSIPKGGIDCSGLILRAAQLCGIPYFCKNSTTILRTLKKLSVTDTIKPGDIIYIPGHVMVISDTKNPMIIEARGYGNGYGRVHEIALNKQFLRINNFQELRYAYEKKIPLQFLNKEGKIVQLIPEFTILKFSSIWECL